jgi:hypothetical protein
VVTGSAARWRSEFALVQDGQENGRQLHCHFEACVVCTEHWSPYQVNAIDKAG